MRHKIDKLHSVVLIYKLGPRVHLLHFERWPSESNTEFPYRLIHVLDFYSGLVQK